SLNLNVVGGSGGGLHLSGEAGAFVRIFGGTVNSNTAAVSGGGLYNRFNNIMVVRDGAVIDGNTANGDAINDGGGGIYNAGGRLSVGVGAVISNNDATGDQGAGGGIFTLSKVGSPRSIVTLAAGTTVSGNTANRSGGGIALIDGTVDVEDSTIDDNHALGGASGFGNGGGIH